jgi:hypothetical protein
MSYNEINSTGLRGETSSTGLRGETSSTGLRGETSSTGLRGETSSTGLTRETGDSTETRPFGAHSAGWHRTGSSCVNAGADFDKEIVTIVRTWILRLKM